LSVAWRWCREPSLAVVPSTIRVGEVGEQVVEDPLLLDLDADFQHGLVRAGPMWR
jgi:hypothetical protein